MERRNFIRAVAGTGGLLITPFVTGRSAELITDIEDNGKQPGTSVQVDESQRYLFLDDHWIREQSGVLRSFHAATKEKYNPLITKKDYGRGYGPYFFVWGRKQFPYTAWFGGYVNTSIDCFNWSALGELDLSAFAAGNISGAAFLNNESGLYSDYPYLCAVAFRHAPDYNKFHYRFGRSRNGFQWEAIPDNPIWDGPSDVMSMIWDKNKKKFVAYYKVWRYKGTTVDGEPFVAYGHLDTKVEDDGKVFHITGETYLPKRTIDVRLQYGGDTSNDGGGAPTDTKMQMIRVLAYAESSDFLHWENEQIIIEPPTDAPLGDQIYGMQVTCYGNMYIGAYNHFNARNGLMQTWLAWSYDGIRFRVHDQQFFIASGKRGEWDYGMIVYPSEFMDTGNGQLYTYYGSIGVDHLATDETQYNGATGRAWLRSDGFASLKGGWIETVPLKVQTKWMRVNMSGEIGVTLKSASGETIGKAVLRGDYHNLIPNIDLSAWIDKDVIVHFDLSKGELYSITI